jgi:hypothetical protein
MRREACRQWRLPAIAGKRKHGRSSSRHRRAWPFGPSDRARRSPPLVRADAACRLACLCCQCCQRSPVPPMPLLSLLHAKSLAFGVFQRISGHGPLHGCSHSAAQPWAVAFHCTATCQGGRAKTVASEWAGSLSGSLGWCCTGAVSHCPAAAGLWAFISAGSGALPCPGTRVWLLYLPRPRQRLVWSFSGERGRNCLLKDP